VAERGRAIRIGRARRHVLLVRVSVSASASAVRETVREIVFVSHRVIRPLDGLLLPLACGASAVLGWAASAGVPRHGRENTPRSAARSGLRMPLPCWNWDQDQYGMLQHHVCFS
jgi:hypothetical protein